MFKERKGVRVLLGLKVLKVQPSKHKERQEGQGIRGLKELKEVQVWFKGLPEPQEHRDLQDLLGHRVL